MLSVELNISVRQFCTYLKGQVKTEELRQSEQKAIKNRRLSMKKQTRLTVGTKNAYYQGQGKGVW